MTAMINAKRSAMTEASTMKTHTALPIVLPLAGKHVHLVGIGGSGMSGLARIIKAHGATCSGSDFSPSVVLESMQRDGINVVYEQTADSVPTPCDLMVISAAVKYDHAEVVEAQRRGIIVLKYAQMLGQLMLGHAGIAVSGTHGKSSTTSMTGHILIQAGLDPTIIVGAQCAQIGGNARIGSVRRSDDTASPSSSSSNLLVAEACEFDRSFHNFHPKLAVILNVEEDHLDTYGSLDAIVDSFHHFAGLLPQKPWQPPVPPPAPESTTNSVVTQQGGYLLIQHELAHRLKITAGLDCTVETIGFAPQADWRVEVKMTGVAEAGDTTATPVQVPRVVLHHRGKVVAQWRNPLPGEHMAYNAAAAAILSHQVGATWPKIIAALESFGGLDRRMQRLGERHLTGLQATSTDNHGVVVIDDYGHHPTEIDTTLRALRAHYQPKRLICVFQPHQHSRTRFLMEQFAASFSYADVVIVPHIFFVRDSEQERKAVSAADLVDRIRQRGGQAMHLYPFEAIVEQLELIAKPGDLLVTMGAGDVWKVAHAFLQAEREG